MLPKDKYKVVSTLDSSFSTAIGITPDGPVYIVFKYMRVYCCLIFYL